MNKKPSPVAEHAQPLDKLMAGLGLKNSDVVKHSTEQLTHKQLHKARLGKRVTSNIQQKILKALNAWAKEDKYRMADLFDY